VRADGFIRSRYPYTAVDTWRAITAQRDSVRDTTHRPWPLPHGRWLVAQSWLDLLFAHWSVDPEVIRRLVPPVLELDTFEGRCWVGVVPFRMRTVRFADCPPVPGTSAFPEVNVRTYVKHDGRAGVFFLSLDAGNPLAVMLGRRMYGLPYLRAEITMRTHAEGVTVSSERTETAWPPAAFAARYSAHEPPALAAPGTLEHWLTERYCFYTATPAKGIRRTDIHHRPWQLQPGVLDLERNSLLEPFAVTVTAQPLLHFSAAQHVVAWPPVTIAA
jgi:uncharacterized protein